MSEVFNQTPYEKAQAVWDSRMGGAVNQIKTWRIMTFALILLLGFSVAGNIYLGQKEKVIPYVVQVGQNGEAAALSPESGLDGPAMQRAISFFLSRFVMLAREIPADAVLVRENMPKLFQLVSTQGKALLTEKFKEKLPSDEFLEKNRALKIASVLEVSKGVYHVDWFEAEYDKGGQKIAEYPMRGTFKIAMLEPKTSAQMRENPLGIFVDFFSWTKLGG
jgi:type IV secretory pathway TrbF-like protein